MSGAGYSLPVGNLGFDDWLYVLAIMTHPSDATARHGFLSAYSSRLAAELNNAHPSLPAPSSSCVVAALDYGGMPRVNRDLEAASFPGALAGETLLHCISLAAYAPEYCSFYKAQCLTTLSLRKRDASGKAQMFGDKTVSNAWSKYKSVAHLYATRNLVTHYGFLGYDPSNPLSVFPQDKLGDYLALSQALHEGFLRLDPMRAEALTRLGNVPALPDAEIRVPPPPPDAIEALANMPSRASH